MYDFDALTLAEIAALISSGKVSRAEVEVFYNNQWYDSEESYAAEREFA